MEKRILVVDDDKLIRELTRDALSEEGFRVVAVASGPEALERMASEGPPEVVISDLSMREMDGLQLLQAIKSEYPKTDVIILTAYASLESALQAMRLGAVDYLRKPVRKPEIVYGVKRTILRRRLLEENTSLRSCLQAYEASRVLTSCLEPGDLLPLAIDIILRLIGRKRAVGRMLDPGSRGSDPVCVVGFSDPQAAVVRDQIDQGKLFDPATLQLPSRATAPDLREALTLAASTSP